MKYTRLRNFLGLLSGEVSRSRNVFQHGVGWFTNLRGNIVIARGTRGDDGVFEVVVKDNRAEWRNKLNQLTSNAEYDLIVKQVSK